jgi:hypothetical protein
MATSARSLSNPPPNRLNTALSVVWSLDACLWCGRKVGKIPPNSALVFYMELVELGDIDKKESFVDEIKKG